MSDKSDPEEFYGIDIANAHARAKEIIPDAFFWDCGDELSPFGSDEGDMALREFRDWRKANPDRPVEDCVIWTIESVGEMDVEDYDESIVDEATVRSQVADAAFDDRQFIHTLDTSVVGTVFGQLVDDGRIDAAIKPYASRALRRLIVWATCQDGWRYADEYVTRLRRLQAALEVA